MPFRCYFMHPVQCAPAYSDTLQRRTVRCVPPTNARVLHARIRDFRVIQTTSLRKGHHRLNYAQSPVASGVESVHLYLPR
eukprot:2483440-Amphidinium_carterae.1